MALYRTDAVVLRTYKLGEADRIVVLYTRTRGKVRAVAKGVRRTKSRFGGRLEPGAVVALQLYEGRNLDVITQAETSALLPSLRSDIDRYGRATILLEVVDQASVEGEANPALFKMLAGALTELERTGAALVVPAFVAKLLVLEGVQPLVDACVTCGRSDDLVALSVDDGGTLCRAHRRGDPISEPARAAFAELFAGRVRGVLESTDEAVGHEVEALAARMIESHLERRLKTSAVLTGMH